MKKRPSDDWKCIIWSDESSVTMLPTSPNCETWSQILMIWAAVISILLVLCVLWMVELLPVTTWTLYVARCILWSRCFLTMVQFFKMMIRPYTLPEVFTLVLRGKKTQHLLCVSTVAQLKILSNHCSVLESRVRSRFPPRSLKHVKEEWYSIPLETVQNLHESIPRRIQAMIQANGGPTPY